MFLKYYSDMAGAGYDNKFCQTVQFHDDADAVETRVINLYPELTYEAFEGFGGAVTEASGYVYSLMDKAQKRQILETYFSKDGMNYQLVRVHMDSCDFCLDTYEAMSDPQDVALDSFPSKEQKNILFQCWRTSGHL